MPNQVVATPQQLALAQKISALAHRPVDELVRTLKLMGLDGQMRAIVLEEVAQHALQEAARGR